MFNQEEIQNIKDVIAEFFREADYEVQIKNISSGEDNETEVLDINLDSPDAQVLIGKQGLVLSDIQMLLRKIIKKRMGRELFLNLDIDSYKKKKEDYLRDLAEDTADEVLASGREKEILLPSPFDRRVVHLELAKRANIIVESVGEGEERRIVIKPKNI
ncbi:MAG: R3H domain-containing nucleic acid-binding protein [Candidatus Paceibacterota bacterium]